MRYLLIVAIFVAAGCATPNYPSKEKMIKSSKEVCTGFGYEIGTPEHAQCTEKEFLRYRDHIIGAEQQRQERIRKSIQNFGKGDGENRRSTTTCTKYFNTVQCETR